MKKMALIGLFLLALMPRAAQAQPLPVVTSFSILADMVRQIGGDAVAVRALVGPDGDAHAYQPTPDDAKALAAAGLVVENGLGFEGWMKRLVAASGYKGPVVIASEGVAGRILHIGREEMGDQPEHRGHMHMSAYDPHAWQDVANARLYVRNIAAALQKALPQDAAMIAARAKAYDAELAALDAWVRQSLAAIPAPQRKIITSHDAFGYFGAAYGVTFMAPQGLSTESEPKAAQIAKLVEQIKAEKVHTLFFESMASPRLVKRLAADGGATVGDAVYSDSLSRADGPAASYTAMIRHNATIFAKAMAENGK